MSQIFAVNSDGTLQNPITVEEFVALAKQGNLVGRYRGVPNETYHRDLPHVSNTDLGKILQSIDHFNEYKKNPPDQTKSLKMGAAFHEAILEPEVFKESWAYMPEFETDPAVTKKEQEEAWKAENDEHNWDNMPKFSPIKSVSKKSKEENWKRENSHLGILTQNELEDLLGMSKAAQNHPILKEMLTTGVAEDVFLAVDPETGLPIKCKADYYHNNGAVNLDLKSTSDASFYAMQRSIANYNYHRQMSFYSHIIALVTGITPKHNVIGAVESKAPHGICIYRLDEASLDVGEIHWKRALAKLAAYRDEKQVEGSAWGGYPLEVVDMNLPAWAFNREEV